MSAWRNFAASVTASFKSAELLACSSSRSSLPILPDFTALSSGRFDGITTASVVTSGELGARDMTRSTKSSRANGRAVTQDSAGRTCRTTQLADDPVLPAPPLHVVLHRRGAARAGAPRLEAERQLRRARRGAGRAPDGLLALRRGRRGARAPDEAAAHARSGGGGVRGARGHLRPVLQPAAPREQADARGARAQGAATGVGLSRATLPRARALSLSRALDRPFARRRRPMAASCSTSRARSRTS